MSGAAPYFLRQQKTYAVIVIHDLYPDLRLVYSAWKVLRSWWFSITCPAFIDVDRHLLRHMEESFAMMINHAAKAMDTGGRAVIGGTDVDVEWSQGNDVALLRVFPRSNKYIIVLRRDADGNVMITTPSMKFGDLPSANQARHVFGQVVRVATSMGMGG